MKKGLSLTRREGESCTCSIGGTTMTIEVEAMEGNRVRLRFVADQSVTILRTELLVRPGGK